MKSTTYLIITLLILLSACKSAPKKDTKIDNNTKQQIAIQNTANYSTWLLEFIRLRKALLQKDADSFFNYPLSDEQSEALCTLISAYNITNKNCIIKNKEDLPQYFDILFPPHLTNNLNQINIDSLNKNHLVNTKVFNYNNDGIDYSTTVIHDNDSKELSIYFNYTYAIEGEDEFVGESATIFIFKLNKHNQLKFDKLLMAG